MLQISVCSSLASAAPLADAAPASSALGAIATGAAKLPSGCSCNVSRPLSESPTMPECVPEISSCEEPVAVGTSSGELRSLQPEIGVVWTILDGAPGTAGKLATPTPVFLSSS